MHRFRDAHRFLYHDFAPETVGAHCIITPPPGSRCTAHPSIDALLQAAGMWDDLQFEDGDDMKGQLSNCQFRANDFKKGCGGTGDWVGEIHTVASRVVNAQGCGDAANKFSTVCGGEPQCHIVPPNGGRDTGRRCENIKMSGNAFRDADFNDTGTNVTTANACDARAMAWYDKCKPIPTKWGKCTARAPTGVTCTLGVPSVRAAIDAGEAFGLWLGSDETKQTSADCGIATQNARRACELDNCMITAPAGQLCASDSGVNTVLRVPGNNSTFKDMDHGGDPNQTGATTDATCQTRAGVWQAKCGGSGWSGRMMAGPDFTFVHEPPITELDISNSLTNQGASCTVRAPTGSTCSMGPGSIPDMVLANEAFGLNIHGGTLADCMTAKGNMRRACELDRCMIAAPSGQLCPSNNAMSAALARDGMFKAMDFGGGPLVTGATTDTSCQERAVVLQNQCGGSGWKGRMEMGAEFTHVYTPPGKVEWSAMLISPPAWGHEFTAESPPTHSWFDSVDFAIPMPVSERQHTQLASYASQCKKGASLWKQACGMGHNTLVTGIATDNRCEIIPDGACEPAPYKPPPSKCTAVGMNAGMSLFASVVHVATLYTDENNNACTPPPPMPDAELKMRTAMYVKAYQSVPTTIYDDTIHGGPMPTDWGTCQARWKELKAHCNWGKNSTYAFNGRFPIDPTSYPSIQTPAKSHGFGYFALHFVKDFVVRAVLAVATDGASELIFGAEEVAVAGAEAVVKEVVEQLSEAFESELKSLVVEEAVNRTVTLAEEVENDLDGGQGFLSSALSTSGGPDSAAGFLDQATGI
jgi:hypothetical protein